MKKYLIYFLICFFSKNIHCDQLQLFSENDVSKLSIIHKEDSIKKNDFLFFGIKINMKDGWKTYWKNPGDSGEAISINFEKNEFVKEYKILFPVPKRYYDSNIETIGYENVVVFPVRLLVSDKKIFKSKIQINYLVCKHICIPISEERELIIDPKKANNSVDSVLQKVIDVNPLYQKKFINFDKVDIKKDKIRIYLKNKSENVNDLKVFTFSENLKFKHKIRFLDKDKLSIFLIPDEKIEYDNKLEILLVDGLGNSNLIDVDLIKPKKNKSLFFMILLSIVGGFILNFMPCVLPVLSFKIYSLIQLSQKKKSRISLFSLTATSGIIFSFLIFGILTIILRNIGADIGWGVQFQNPTFLSIFSLILIIFSLNLIGFFEILTPSIINNLGKINIKNNYLSTFFTGILSTALATPCSAPFLGTAISFAYTQNDLYTIIIFFSLGIGFSIPYLLIMLSPKLLNIFPRPGNWMILVKFILGLLVLLTSFWLLSLLNFEKIYLFLTYITIGFTGIYLLKYQQKITYLLISIVILTSILIYPKNKQQDDKIWMAFNPEKMKEFINKDELVFVDVTADWCITCKVNKITTLDNRDMREYFKKNNVKLLKADWTDRNEVIQEYMKEFNKFGIPLNVIYGPKNKKGIVQPELLSKSNIINSINLVK